MTTAAETKAPPPQRGHGILYLAAAVASLSDLLFGYDTGVVSGALLFLKAQYHLSPLPQEVVTGVVLVGASLGLAGSGRLADPPEAKV
jgi:MFS family permease